MFKRIVAFALALVVVFCLWNVAGASSVYDRQKKSIYFVMDDSGSMDGKPENDANYSLQSLIAMCDKEDTVNLYFLNSKSGSAKKVDLSKKDNTVIKNIKDTYPTKGGGTPYAAVETAKRELTDSVTKDDTSDHWLVVLTDGGFNDGPDPGTDLLAFSEKPLANGKYPNVLFISIGGSVVMKNEGNLHYLPGNDIIQAMNKAAKMISGRVEAKVSYENDNKELKFTVPYPAKNIVVFSQNIETKITSYKSDSKLDISENYNVEYPVEYDEIGKSTVCFVREANNSSISSKEITFVFDKPLVPANTVVLIEPAIGITAHYYNEDGVEITPEELKIGSTVKVKYSLCDSETKKPLDEKSFEGVKYSSKIDDKEFNSNEFEFVIGEKELDIELNATLPDGYVFSTRKKYSDLKERRDILFTLSNGGSFKSDYDKLDKAEGVYANVLVNGKTPSAEEFKNFRIRIKGENIISSNFSIKADEKNGAFVINPKKGLVGAFTPKDKSYDVVLTDEKTGDYIATLRVEIPGERPWISVLIFGLSVLAALYLIWVFASKKYFPLGTCLKLYMDESPEEDSEVIPEIFSFARLYWNEFTRVFRGDFTFFKHLLIQLLPNQRLCVTLYGVGSPGEGEYSDITICASRSRTVLVQDRTLSPSEMGGYTSDFVMYDTDASTVLSFDYMVAIDGQKRRGYNLSLNQYLVKSIVQDYGADIYYLKFTKKGNID